MIASQEMDQPISYRSYESGDENAIIELFNLVFRKDLKIGQWNWAYNENPIKRMDIILALSDRKLVGHSASTPLEFHCQGNCVQATRVQNVMVHPDYQGRGIFTETLKRLTEHFYSHNLDLVVTFPNNNSLPTFIKKLDYSHIDDIYTYHLPSSLMQNAGSRSLDVCIDQKIKFNDMDDTLIRSCLDCYEIYNRRAAEYLHWRFNERSNKKYFLLRAFEKNHEAALVIFKYYPEMRSVDIVELFVEGSGNNIPSLLLKIKNFYENSGMLVDSFNIWSMPHYTCYDAIIDAGFEKTQFCTHMVTKSFSSKTVNGYNKPVSYYLSMSDSDVY